MNKIVVCICIEEVFVAVETAFSTKTDNYHMISPIIFIGVILQLKCTVSAKQSSDKGLQI